MNQTAIGPHELHDGVIVPSGVSGNPGVFDPSKQYGCFMEYDSRKEKRLAMSQLWEAMEFLPREALRQVEWIDHATDADGLGVRTIGWRYWPKRASEVSR